MKLLKIACVVAAIQFATPVLAQEAAADVNTLFASAQAEGKTLNDFVVQMTNLKTCNPELAEQVVEFALEQAKDDPVLVEEILKTVSNSCVDQDTATSLAIAMGIDPTLVANALKTATAAGATAPQAGGARLTAAAAPATLGAGGGTGAGVITASLN